MPPSVALAAPNRGGEPNPMQVARIWTVCLRFANLVTTCSRPSPRHCLRSLDIVRIEDSSPEHLEAAADTDDRDVFFRSVRTYDSRPEERRDAKSAMVLFVPGRITSGSGCPLTGRLVTRTPARANRAQSGG
jgi:hypothetical protein